MQETWVRSLGSIPGLGRSPGEGNSYPLQYSGWTIPWTIQSMVAKSQTRLSDFHFALIIVHPQCMWMCAQTCPTLCTPVDCSLLGSIHGILQARILERVAISFSRGSSQHKDRTWSPADSLPLSHFRSPYNASASSVTQSLWPHGLSMPGLPVHHQLPELAQTHHH